MKVYWCLAWFHHGWRKFWILHLWNAKNNYKIYFWKFIDYLADGIEAGRSIPKTKCPRDLPSSPPGKGEHSIKIITLPHYYYQISFLSLWWFEFGTTFIIFKDHSFSLSLYYRKLRGQREGIMYSKTNLQNNRSLLHCGWKTC